MIVDEANVIHSECLEWMRGRPTDSVDLAFGSPPYEKARTYGIDFALSGQGWVDWMVERIREMVRICRGLVAMVAEGQTRQFSWSATPALLMADLHRAGICLRKPPLFHRVGIPGSGGPDWLRNDYEFIVCCTKGGKLPWSDNTAMGHTPKWATGGICSNRLRDGSRMNRDEWGSTGHKTGMEGRSRNGEFKSRRRERGNGKEASYVKPKIANPGNVIACKVGGGLMGSSLSHENEAPFPESLAEFFVRSFCPPGGLVYDPFSGSGTTGAVAIKTGRRFVGTDVRESQVDLTKRRLVEAAEKHAA